MESHGKLDLSMNMIKLLTQSVYLHLVSDRPVDILDRAYFKDRTG